MEDLYISRSLTFLNDFLPIDKLAFLQVVLNMCINVDVYECVPKTILAFGSCFKKKKQSKIAELFLETSQIRLRKYWHAQTQGFFRGQVGKHWVAKGSGNVSAVWRDSANQVCDLYVTTLLCLACGVTELTEAVTTWCSGSRKEFHHPKSYQGYDPVCRTTKTLGRKQSKRSA